MAKDRRLYAKFDINMDEHPKILMLSDAAFRALFESTLYSRRQLSDGFLDERIVLRKWGAEAAAELTSNDPLKPSWIKVEGGYQIHDFAEHQTTTEDIEKKREAGRRGGLAKAEHNASKPLAPATKVLEQKGSNTLAKTETETNKKTSSSPATPPMEFDRFWAEYPRKVGKQAAIKAYTKSLKLTTSEQILAGVKLLRRETAGKEPEFIPHPASWLNAGRWEDEPTNKPAANSPWNKDFYK